MNNYLIFAGLFSLIAPQSAIGQNKGFLTITQSETAATSLYDGAMAQLKAAGVWEWGWTFHAIGAMQPTGLLSIGVFPDKATLEARVAKTTEVFKTNNISSPAPQAFEIYNLLRAPLLTTVPAGAILVHFAPKAMSAAQYDQILVELNKVGQGENPARPFHVAFKGADGNLQVLDIWSSGEAFQAFGGTLVPILGKMFGEAPQPAVYGLYNVFSK